MDMIRIYQNICKLQYVLIMLSHGQCVQVKSCKQIKELPSTEARNISSCAYCPF